MLFVIRFNRPTNCRVSVCSRHHFENKIRTQSHGYILRTRAVRVFSLFIFLFRWYHFDIKINRHRYTRGCSHKSTIGQQQQQPHDTDYINNVRTFTRINRYNEHINNKHDVVCVDYMSDNHQLLSSRVDKYTNNYSPCVSYCNVIIIIEWTRIIVVVVQRSG